MANTVNLDLLRQVKTDSLRVYEAIRRAETLNAENHHVAALAEDLLRQAGLAYLTEGLGDITQKGQLSSEAAYETLVSGYIRVQQAYVDLKDAMYQLGKKLLEEGTTTEAQLILRTLLDIDPNYGDAQTLLRQEFITRAKFLFEQKQWEEGRTILKEGIHDRNVRLEFLNSFLKENNSMDGLRALQQAEPAVVKLASFQKALRIVDQLAEAEGAWNALTSPWMPYKPYELILDSQEENDRKRMEYELEMANYHRELVKYNQKNEPLEEKVYTIRNVLEQAIRDVQAELPSVI